MAERFPFLAIDRNSGEWGVGRGCGDGAAAQMRVECRRGPQQPDHAGPAVSLVGGDDLQTAQHRTRRTTDVRRGERQRFDRPGTVLVGFRAPQTNVHPVEPVYSDVAAVELTAPERTREPHQQQGGVAALEDFTGPTGNSVSGVRHDGHDVGSQERSHLPPGPITSQA